MAVFAVIAPEPDTRVEPAIILGFPNAFYKITDSQFLVSSATLTTNQVSEKLGCSGGNIGCVLIFRVAAFTGWHSTDLWEWIAAAGGAGATGNE